MPRTQDIEIKTSEKKAGAGLAKFLKSVYHVAAWSRQEAARRAGISEGYLCHILAGDVQLPRTELFRSLVDGWNINPIDLFKATGYLSEADIEKYYRRNRMASSAKEDPEIQAIVDALTSMDPAEREMALPVIKALLFNRRKTVTHEVAKRSKTAA